MNKAELIEYVADATGLTKKLATDAVEAVIDGITKTLAKKGEVTLIGFGTFKVVTRKARTGINPQTKAKIKIPARKVPTFKAGSALKAKIK